jgi:phosphatidylglycerol:prolipoprotein diacylglycerol transferase
MPGLPTLRKLGGNVNFSGVYTAILIGGILGSIAFWRKLARGDGRLLPVYIGALIGSFAGAKIVYIAAEGWLHYGKPDFLLQLATGKTILGALLGGYIAVEFVKRQVGYSAPTGDWFAMIVPVTIGLGRFGCMAHGCCLGAPTNSTWCSLSDSTGIFRWPIAPMELGFNVIAVCTFALLRARGAFPNQHFHLYLIAYGAFRFLEEFVRDTPRLFIGLTGYHFAAAAVLVIGIVAFVTRAQSNQAGTKLHP